VSLCDPTKADYADDRLNFYGLQTLISREMVEAREVLVRRRMRRASNGLLVPIQLQLLQSEMLPFEKTETAASGNRIRCGIEFDAIGRRQAYHFRRRHPGDSTDQGVFTSETVRVPAGDVLHIYRPIDAGQIRGLPHVAPAMVRLFLLDQYDDAELDRKKTAAMFAGFITKTAPEEQLMGEIEATNDSGATVSLEPGTLQVLLPGEDVKFSSPADVGGGYEAFQYRTLLSVSASLGLLYHLVTGDVRQANYSSLRAELVEFRRRVDQLQHGVVAHQLCRPVWARWLETAVLSGALEIGMMLGHEVFDPELNRRVLVDHAFIVAGGEITKAARNWLGNKLDAAKRSQVMFMDREDILYLFIVTNLPLPKGALPPPRAISELDDEIPFWGCAP
jgi:lambda family phage portal protein